MQQRHPLRSPQNGHTQVQSSTNWPHGVHVGTHPYVAAQARPYALRIVLGIMARPSALARSSRTVAT